MYAEQALHAGLETKLHRKDYGIEPLPTWHLICQMVIPAVPVDEGPRMAQSAAETR